jgi:hypothetical protein
MSATTLTAELADRQPHVPRRPRLVSAELLKLRKRRGLVLSSLGLTVLPMVVAYIVLLSLHAANSVKHGPAGGLKNFTDSMDLLTTLSGVAAIMIGATLGAGDLSSGVFRELVITGRSRLALFAARLPAGVAVVWLVAGLGFAVTAGASTVFAGSLTGPSWTLIVEAGAWLALVTGVSLALALGVSSLFGSRGTTMGIVLGWQLVAAPILLQIKALGWFREALVGAAEYRLQPDALFNGGPTVAMSLVAAVGVIVAWTLVPLAFGAWRTMTRDA